MSFISKVYFEETVKGLLVLLNNKYDDNVSPQAQRQAQIHTFCQVYGFCKQILDKLKSVIYSDTVNHILLENILDYPQLFIQLLMSMAFQPDVAELLETSTNNNFQNTTEVVPLADRPKSARPVASTAKLNPIPPKGSNYVTCCLMLIVAIRQALAHCNTAMTIEGNKKSQEGIVVSLKGYEAKRSTIQGKFLKEMVPIFYEIVWQLIQLSDGDSSHKYFADYSVHTIKINAFLHYGDFSIAQQRSMFVITMITLISEGTYWTEGSSDGDEDLSNPVEKDKAQYFRLLTILLSIISKGSIQEVSDQTTTEGAGSGSLFVPAERKWLLPNCILHSACRCVTLRWMVASVPQSMALSQASLANDLINLALQTQRYDLFYAFQVVPELAKSAISLITTKLMDIVNIPLHDRSDNVTTLTSGKSITINVSFDWGISYLLRAYTERLLQIHEVSIIKLITRHNVSILLNKLVDRLSVVTHLLNIKVPTIIANYEHVLINLCKLFPVESQSTVDRLMETWREEDVKTTQFLIQIIEIAGRITEQESVDRSIGYLIELLKAKDSTPGFMVLPILTAIYSLQDYLSAQSITISKGLSAIKRYHILHKEMVHNILLKIEFISERQAKDNQYQEVWKEMKSSQIDQIQTDLWECKTMEEIMGIISSNLNKVQCYLDLISKKVPLPIRLQINTMQPKVVTLVYECAFSQLEVFVELRKDYGGDRNKYLMKLVFLLLLTDRLLLAIDNQCIAHDVSFKVQVLGQIYKVLGDDLQQCVSTLFLGLAELETMVNTLKSRGGILNKMGYFTNDIVGGWNILQPDIDGIDAVSVGSSMNIEEVQELLRKWKADDISICGQAVLPEAISDDAYYRVYAKQDKSDKSISMFMESLPYLRELFLTPILSQYTMTLTSPIAVTSPISHVQPPSSPAPVASPSAPASPFSPSAPEPAPKHVTINLPKLTGFITKQGSFFRTWKRRYFILEHRKLTYYSNAEDGMNQVNPLGQPFPLYHGAGTHRTQLVQNGLILELKNPSRKGNREILPLKFDNPETLRMWLSTLEMHCISQEELDMKASQEQKRREVMGALTAGTNHMEM